MDLIEKQTAAARQSAELTNEPMQNVTLGQMKNAIGWSVFWAIIAAETVMGLILGIVWAMLQSGS